MLEYSNTLTLSHQHIHILACLLILLIPPAVEECNLHIDEPPLWVGQQVDHHSVQDVYYTCSLDVSTIEVVRGKNMCLGLHMG